MQGNWSVIYHCLEEPITSNSFLAVWSIVQFLLWSLYHFRLEASTQEIVTPSFVITSAIRSSSALGSVVSEAVVGETLYWTIDIPGNCYLG